jgi:hypothetical protein
MAKWTIKVRGETDEERMVGVINPLIRKAFGFFTAGNYQFQGLGPIEDCYRVRGLHSIVRSFGIYTKHLGFVSKDGSTISVLPQYGEKARKYAQLYEDRMGGLAHIILSDAPKEEEVGLGRDWVKRV